MDMENLVDYLLGEGRSIRLHFEDSPDDVSHYRCDVVDSTGVVLLTVTHLWLSHCLEEARQALVEKQG